MARSKKRGSDSGSDSGYRFINVHLVKADEEWLSACDAQTEFPLSAIFDLVQEGFKVSFNEDSRNSSFVASLTDTREDSSFYKHILTGRGATSADSWLSLAYKHYQIAEGDWHNIASEESGKPSRFG